MMRSWFLTNFAAVHLSTVKASAALLSKKDLSFATGTMLVSASSRMSGRYLMPGSPQS